MVRTVVSDTQQRIGRLVSAKAVHITSLSKCMRWYGSLEKSKWVDDVVKEVFDSSSSTVTKRRKTIVQAEYDFGEGVEKLATLNIRIIKARLIPNTALDEESLMLIDPNLLKEHPIITNEPDVGTVHLSNPLPPSPPLPNSKK